MDTEQSPADGPGSELRGRRLLVVEDSPVVADACEEMLKDFGCVVIGPAGTMAAALQLAAEERFDAAVIDINIRGDKAFSVLKILRDRGIPFLLTSGYADWTMPEEWQGQPRLAKPYTATILRAELLELLPA